jgi:hypothetical protein
MLADSLRPSSKTVAFEAAACCVADAPLAIAPVCAPPPHRALWCEAHCRGADGQALAPEVPRMPLALVTMPGGPTSG